MKIEDFVGKSIGAWKSMRSGHSLAFQQFEEIRSTINITLVDKDEPILQEMLENYKLKQKKISSPFSMSWEAESDWDYHEKASLSSGSTLLVPIPVTPQNGIILRSQGYFEAIKATSKYQLLSDQTLILHTEYEETIAEERIWFLNDNVRCRASVIKATKTSGILQTSFASEIRQLNNQI